MKRSVLISSLRWCALALVGCAPPPAARTVAARLASAAVDGTNALAETRALVELGPRVSGTDGARRAAEHLAARLRALDVDVEMDEFSDPTPAGKTVFRNVIARIPGHGAGIVLLASHYDTKSDIAPDFAGANDSGSSSGLLLELARRLRQAPPLPFAVRLAWLDGEECAVQYGPADGLHGSRRLLRQLRAAGELPRVRALILADMIGDRDWNLTLPRNCTPALLQAVFDAARAEGVRSRVRLLSGNMTDDHEPFFDAGVPAVNLIDFEFGSAPGRNDYWHTPEDTLDKLHPDSLAITGRIIIHLLNHLAAAESTPSVSH